MRLSLLAGILVAPLAGCHSYLEVYRPSEFIETKQPTRLWVTETDDSLLVMEAPEAHGNALTGYVAGQYRTIEPSEMKLVQTRTVDWLKTSALFSAVVLGSALIVRYGVENEQKSTNCAPCASCQRPPECGVIP